jgi:hypothetical protein
MQFGSQATEDMAKNVDLGALFKSQVTNMMAERTKAVGSVCCCC